MTPATSKPPLPRRTPQRVATDKIQEAVDARDVPAAALTSVGIQLPAMDVRTPWPVTDDSDAGQATRYALVHLGVCSAPVALALAAVIVEGAGR
ncbi:hypothetical protein GCM10011583_51930 [Streptomyces camponoticapitis]|uniref:Uncharacterized protein n=1 Tax=Streptomyces camponoticapitis TaxID=1616125 RepID=A0ABQ2EIP5_9ACTN|nr:hypothetical protein [Streptomyces camponoticapitis]GGK13556.1 hypothetical protein GCM10011583_51930 [Streptomyces camponoticapitis]